MPEQPTSEQQDRAHERATDDRTVDNDAQTTRDEEQQGEASLMELVTAITLLLRQVWGERLALFRAEGQLAVKSLVLVVLVLFCMALAVTLIWVSILVAVSMVALEAGAHWAWVALGVIVAQLLSVWYLKTQLDQLLNGMSFPETRRSFAWVQEPTPLKPHNRDGESPPEESPSSSRRTPPSREEPSL